MAKQVRAYSTVLVTGGHGLVGSAIQWAVSPDRQPAHPSFGLVKGEKWVFVGSADGDLRHYEDTYALFSKHQPDAVIHLAARVGGVFENSLKPAEFVADNLAIDQTVLRVCKELGTKRLVSCLSNCIFPDEISYPITEDKLHDGPPHHSNFGYAHAKRMLEVTSRAYRQQFGCDFLTVVPVNLFGPHDNFGDDCHAMPAIIRNVVQATQAGSRNLVIPGNGAARRQFMYSRDLAQLIVWTLRMYDDSLPLLLSVDPAQEVSIKQIVQLVCTSSGFQGNISWDHTKTNGQLRKTVDNSRMKNLIGSFQFTPLEQATKETIEWFSANQNHLRNGTQRRERKPNAKL